MVWPALIAAAGQIGGGLLANRNRPSPGDALFQSPIQNSPLYQQMQLMSMIQQGARVTPQMLGGGSPLATLLNAAQSIGLKQKGARNFSKLLPDLQRVINAGKAAGKSAAEIKMDLEALPFWGANKGEHNKISGNMSNTASGAIAGAGLGPLGAGLGAAVGSAGINLLDPLGLFNDAKKPDKEKGREVMRRLMAASGYNSLEDLIQAELDFEASSAEDLGPMNQAADAAQRGRLDAIERIAGIQSDFVAPTRAEIEQQARTVEEAFRGQVARERADQELALLTQAQQLGINPGARLGRLDEWQAQKNLEAQPEGLARALQLLSGQQGLQSNALTALQGSLNAADQTPLALAQIQSGNQIGLGQIAAQQAMNLAGLQQQGDQFAASGVANAGNAIARWLAQQQFSSQQNGLVGGQAAAPFDPNSLDQYAGLIR